MKTRFLADCDFNNEIVDGLLRREPGVDIQTALDAGLPGMPAAAVLARAAEEGRLLLTHDLHEVPQHFTAFVAARTSPGVLVVSQQMEISAAMASLLHLWMVTDAEEWSNRLFYLPLPTQA